MKKRNYLKTLGFARRLNKMLVFVEKFDIFSMAVDCACRRMRRRLPLFSQMTHTSQPELLAPAGDFSAACAAFHYGADAVYAGLPRFSARAEAVNLTPEELRRIVAHAHALQPRRRVYVTFNTLVQEHELAAAVETLEELDDIGVDGVIVQDLGVYRLARRAFPHLRLHASTQLAVHNLAGARALAELGFSRVVLARELALDEIAAISREAGIEIEIFVHGALCYSYSGVCLFSSHQTGRSGNRGRCAYCCREPLTPAMPDGQRENVPAQFPFSMRDLALAPLLHDVAAAGVASLKIEGRMKNALYVACVTDYYRRKLDGRLAPDEEARLVEDLQTIFSRPWTQLYAAGRDADAATIIDPAAVGHRGAPIGEVQTVTVDAAGRWLRFQMRRALEKHDGLQIELPRGGKPYGFAVMDFRRVGSSRLEVELPAGTLAEFLLPPEETPMIPSGSTVFCSASQAVRRRYEIPKLRSAESRLAHPVHVRVALATDGFTLTARTEPAHADTPSVEVTQTTTLALTPARQPDQTRAAIERAFAKSGDTPWQMTHLDLDDPQKLFVPASALNAARRSLFDLLTTRHNEQRQAKIAETLVIFAISAAPAKTAAPTDTPPHWCAKLLLDGSFQAALPGADEIILQIGHLDAADARAKLETWLTVLPRQRLRLALPIITRSHEEASLAATVAALLADGWTRWECANIAGIHLLRSLTSAALDLTTDWSCYGLNHIARDFLAEQNILRAVASPEDTADNIAALATAGGPEMEVIVWQNTPLFLSETAPAVKPSPDAASQNFVNRRGGCVTTHRVDGRWITIAEEPLCLIDHVASLRRDGVNWLRADFSWSPQEAVSIALCWDDLRAGRAPARSHTANFLRGLA